MLKIILLIYCLVDLTFLVFLIKQYKQLIQSKEYVDDSLMARFIVGCLAVGGVVFTLLMLIGSFYFIIVHD